MIKIQRVSVMIPSDDPYLIKPFMFDGYKIEAVRQIKMGKKYIGLFIRDRLNSQGFSLVSTVPLHKVMDKIQLIQKITRENCRSI